MYSRVRFLAAVLGAACSIGAAATPAFAQGPEYTPDGVPLGAFRGFPTFYVGAFHGSNIYRANTNGISDTYFGIGGALAVESNWSQHMLNLRGSIDSFHYGSQSSEDRTNWSIGTSARLDVQRGSEISFAASHSQQHELRNDPNTGLVTVSPVEFGATHVEASARYMPAKVGIEAGGSFDTFTYVDSTLTAGGILDNSDRDRDIFRLFGSVYFSPAPTYSIFARLGYNERSYSLSLDRNNLDRDSKGYSTDFGVQLELTRLVQGGLFIGYYNQTYSAPLGDLSGFRFGGDLSWEATPLITVNFSASHILADTTLPFASAGEQSRVGVALDYELLRNLMVNGGISYLFVNYDNQGFNDSYVELTGGLRYYLNRTISAGANYTYSNRSSSLAGQDYGTSVISTRVNVHL